MIQRRHFLALPLAQLMLLIPGCPSINIVQLIQAIVSAIEIILPLIPEMSPSVATKVADFSHRTISVIPPLTGGPLTSASLETAINAFKGVTIPSLTIGTQAQQLVSAATDKVDTFISKVQEQLILTPAATAIKVQGAAAANTGLSVKQQNLFERAAAAQRTAAMLVMQFPPPPVQ